MGLSRVLPEVVLCSASNRPSDFDATTGTTADIIIIVGTTATLTCDTTILGDRLVDGLGTESTRHRALDELRSARSLMSFLKEPRPPANYAPYRFASLPGRPLVRRAAPRALFQPGFVEARRHARKRYLQRLRVRGIA